MARGRMLSKDISLDEKVDALPDDTARLLFTWMIPHLDCEGRMYGDPQIFKSIVAPRRNYTVKKVEKSLEQMEKLGLIVRYEVNKNCYLTAPNFEKHQVGLQKEKEAKSKLPSIDDKTSGVIPELIQSDNQPTLTQGEGEEKLKRKLKKKSNNKGASPPFQIKKETSDLAIVVQGIYDYYGYPEKTNIDPIPNYGKEGKAIKRMLDRRFSPEDILECWKQKTRKSGTYKSMVYVNEDIKVKTSKITEPPDNSQAYVFLLFKQFKANAGQEPVGPARQHIIDWVDSCIEQGKSYDEIMDIPEMAGAT